MQNNQRPAIAAIAYMLIANKQVSSVYCYKQSKYISLSGEATLKSVNIYDYDRQTYISGSDNSLYDYGTKSYVSLDISGKTFNGYDYNSSAYFSGNIQNGSVSLYDYETSQYYSFAV